MAEPEVSQSGQSVDGNGDGGRAPTSSVSLSVSKEAALESLIFTKGIKLAKSRFAVLSAPYRLGVARSGLQTAITYTLKVHLKNAGRRQCAIP